MKVIVVGATGYTGRLICSELHNKDIKYSISGRNLEALKSIEETYSSVEDMIVSDITNDSDILNIINYDIIINCVGPFQLYSEKLVSAAVEHCKIYLDINGEEVFVEQSIKKHYSSAQNNKAIIAHSVAFESALSDILVKNITLRHPNLHSIQFHYRFGSSKPSPGTKFTMKLSKFRDSYFIHDNARKSINKEDIIQISYNDQQYTAIPYPLPEIPITDIKYDIPNISSYLLTDELSATLTLSNREDNITTAIEKSQRRKSKGPTEEQRKNQTFDIILIAIDKDKNEHRSVLSGNDMYLVTAKIITFAIKRLLTKNIIPCGFISPSELINEEAEILFKYLGVEYQEYKPHSNQDYD